MILCYVQWSGDLCAYLLREADRYEHRGLDEKRLRTTGLGADPRVEVELPCLPAQVVPEGTP